MRVALLGFGLIGGSIARAVALLEDGGGDERIEIVAWSPSGAGPRAAAREGFVEAATSPRAAVDDADLIVLAAPPLACLDLLDSLAREWRPALRPDATVSDVASTKRALVRRAATLALPFVGGHPMAGREMAGYEAADARLFAGRPWAVVAGPTTRPQDIRRVERLALACGARPIEMSASDHDRATAGISHLPLVLSAALVEAVAGTDADGGAEAGALQGAAFRPDRADWALARTLAAGGWQGMTRLARGDPAMGAGILATNADEVAVRLHQLRDIVDGWLTVLEREPGPDASLVEGRLRAAAERLRDDAPGAGEGSDDA